MWGIRAGIVAFAGLPALPMLKQKHQKPTHAFDMEIT